MGLLGAHVSISGGLEKSIERGTALDCEVIQIFSKNQRQWKSPPLTDESIQRFCSALSKSKIRQVIIHDSYLINLAHPGKDARKKSLDFFVDEMIRADLLGVPYLVFHPGSHIQTSIQEGIERITESLNSALDRQPDGKVMLLLETTAGMGNHIGNKFEHLADIIEGVKNKKRVGVCFDTAHTFEAGYGHHTLNGYKKVFHAFDSIIGLNYLKVFHLNDSKTDLGKRVDRHQNIGKGYIGEEMFRLLVNDSRFMKHPMILETPEGDEWFKRNMQLLKSFAK